MRNPIRFGPSIKKKIVIACQKPTSKITLNQDGTTLYLEIGYSDPSYRLFLDKFIVQFFDGKNWQTTTLNAQDKESSPISCLKIVGISPGMYQLILSGMFKSGNAVYQSANASVNLTSEGITSRVGNYWLTTLHPIKTTYLNHDLADDHKTLISSYETNRNKGQVLDWSVPITISNGRTFYRAVKARVIDYKGRPQNWHFVDVNRALLDASQNKKYPLSQYLA